MTYHQKLTAHLSTYLKGELGLEDCGVYEHKGQSIPKEYILPAGQKWLNILPGVRESVKAYLEERPHIRLHRSFHHLNSSQAFTLNLFIPYFEAGSTSSKALLDALGVRGSLGEWELEQVPDAEEQTNIDVSWRLTEGEGYLCEVKLSERDFGAAKEDEKHVQKLAKTYAPVLRDHVDEALLQPKLFCGNYQILRLAWCAVKEKTSTLMFVLPRSNEQLWPKLSKILPRFTKELQARILTVAIEDVLESLVQNPNLSPDLREHATHLAAKYVLPD